MVIDYFIIAIICDTMHDIWAYLQLFDYNFLAGVSHAYAHAYVTHGKRTN